MTVTLTGPQNAIKPGAVNLRVLVPRDAPKIRALQAQLKGYQAWASGTNASYRPQEFRGSGLKRARPCHRELRATEGSALAADAMLVKANVLLAYYIDVRQSYETARRAVAAYQTWGGRPRR